MTLEKTVHNFVIVHFSASAASISQVVDPIQTPILKLCQRVLLNTNRSIVYRLNSCSGIKKSKDVPFQHVLHATDSSDGQCVVNFCDGRPRDRFEKTCQVIFGGLVDKTDVIFSFREETAAFFNDDSNAIISINSSFLL